MGEFKDKFDELVRFAKQHLNAGTSVETVRAQLKNLGYNKTEVKQVMTTVRSKE